jgi:hypothetical protein
MGPNNARLVRIFPRKTGAVIADVAFPSNAAFEAVIECETGTAIHATGAKYEITIDVVDFSSMASIILSGIVASGHLRDANWPTQAMQFVFPLATPGTFKEGHIWKIFASLKIGVMNPSNSIAESELFLITSP